MAELIVKWGNKLSGEIQVSWSKNAALPIIWASLLLAWKVKLNKVPKIWDVYTFLDILESIWVSHYWEQNSLNLDATNLNNKNFNFEKIKKIRSSIFLLSPLLYFFKEIFIPFPGWCRIWKRPIDDHLNGLKNIWYDYEFDWENIKLNWELNSGEKTLNAWFSVSATENLIVANVLRKWETIIKNSAIEPHVMNLIDFMRESWADIKLRYNHEIIISWVEKLKKEVEFDIVSDYIESGTYMVIAALASEKYLDIKDARIEDLYIFIEKLKEAWVKLEELWNDVLRVYKTEKIKPVSFQTNIFPWFPTDLQSPFAILQSQANWISKINEIMFEWRLNFLVELEKMTAKIAILNPHQALIFWPNNLRWTTVTSWDLRAWMAMIIAWLIASWETKVTNVEYVYRGYENFVEKLRNLWAEIIEDC